MCLIYVMLSFWAAFLMIDYCGGKWNKSEKSARWLHINLAIGLGLGMTSYVYFIRMLIYSGRNIFSDIMEISVFGLIIGIIYFFLFLKADKKSAVSHLKSPQTVSEKKRLILVAFGITFSLSMVYFILISINNIHGSWDAWAIWNMRARFFFRSGEQWERALSASQALPHTDYPLLVPLVISKIWTCLGRDSVFIPATIAFLFTFLTVGLLVFALAYFRSMNHGLLAGLVLIGFNKFIQRGATQCADIPFGFYLLATLVFFYLHGTSPAKNRGFIALAGSMTGLAAWTKNEGLLLICSVMVAHLTVTLPDKGWKEYARQWAGFMAGLLPAIVLIAYFKLRLTPPNDLITAQSAPSVIAKLSDVSRHLTITGSFMREFFELTKIRLAIFPALAFILGRLHPNRFKNSNHLAAIVMGFMLSGYYMVYVLTPHNLVWHLNTSLERLYLQLLPSLLFIFFSTLKTPECALKHHLKA